MYISNNADDADNDEVIVKGRMSHSEFVDMLQTYRNSTKGLHDGQMSSSRPKIKVEKVNRVSTRSVSNKFVTKQKKGVEKKQSRIMLKYTKN